MIAKITLRAAVPEEDKAKVNNVIPLSLLLGCNHQSHCLINIVCSHKRCDAFAKKFKLHKVLSKNNITW